MFRCLSLLLMVLISAGCHAAGLPGKSSISSSGECVADSECALGIRINVCCSCPEVTTRARLGHASGMVDYDRAREFGSSRPFFCKWADCSPCLLPPAGAFCIEGRCQAPRTATEVLATCPECFGQAALVIYGDGNAAQAQAFCRMETPERRARCMTEVFALAVNANRLDDAERFCRSGVIPDSGACLRTVAVRLAQIDPGHAASLCEELVPSDVRRQLCLKEVSLAAAK
jgi:hypothetical protein